MVTIMPLFAVYFGSIGIRPRQFLKELAIVNFIKMSGGVGRMFKTFTGTYAISDSF